MHMNNLIHKGEIDCWGISRWLSASIPHPIDSVEASRTKSVSLNTSALL